MPNNGKDHAKGHPCSSHALMPNFEGNTVVSRTLGCTTWKGAQAFATGVLPLLQKHCCCIGSSAALLSKIFLSHCHILYTLRFEGNTPDLQGHHFGGSQPLWRQVSVCVSCVTPCDPQGTVHALHAVWTRSGRQARHSLWVLGLSQCCPTPRVAYPAGGCLVCWLMELIAA